MITIIPGRIVKLPPSKVWAGIKFKCPGCNGTFIIQENDKWIEAGTKKFFHCETVNCPELIYLNHTSLKVTDFNGNKISIT